MLEELEERLEQSQQLKKIVLDQYLYYVIIFVASVIVLVFLPMVGSVAGIGFSFPTSKLGWAIYILTKLFVAGFNVLIFICFVKQGKVNARNDPDYIAACKKINKIDRKSNSQPRSPKKFLANEYGKKGVMIFLTTAVSLVVLTEAILKFDWMALLVYLVTVVMAIVFGVMEMVKVQSYWKTEFVLYADKLYMLEFGEEQVESDTKKEITTNKATDAEQVAKLLLPMEVKK